MRDHHGKEIPEPKHSREHLRNLTKSTTANISLRRVHPRENAPKWDRNLTVEEQVGFDLENIQKHEQG